MNEINIKISNHASQRYAERIMSKEDTDIQRFMITHEQKIHDDIEKLIQYGQLIYSGKQKTRDGKTNNVDVYLNGTWVVLVDAKTYNVITLYKIDLGLDESFNNEYVSKMLEKLQETERKRDMVKLKLENENENYKELIQQSQDQIKEYKGYINNLVELIDGYQRIIDNNTVELSVCDNEVAGVVNQLIGKREF